MLIRSGICRTCIFLTRRRSCWCRTISTPTSQPRSTKPRDLFLDVRRFDELVEDLGISRNLLTSRLRSLAKKGVIERVAYQSHPLRYEYRLTNAGLDLVPAILALSE